MQHTPSGIPRHPALGIDNIHTPAGVWVSQEAQDTTASNAEVRGGQMGRLQISWCLSGTTVDNMTNDYITSGAILGV